MDKFRASFSDLRAGWILLALEYAGRVIAVNVSYVRDSFPSLVDALICLNAAPGEATVVWQCEPSECEFNFAREADRVTLDVLFFQDISRNVFDWPEPELSIIGSYEEVCLPFWRALRCLHGLYSEAEWEAQWRRRFPSEGLNKLTASLDKG